MDSTKAYYYYLKKLYSYFILFSSACHFFHYYFLPASLREEREGLIEFTCITSVFTFRITQLRLNREITNFLDKSIKWNSHSFSR